MKTTSLIASLSRHAGGLFESVRRLHQSLAEISGVQVTVLGLRDTFSEVDLPAWKPLTVGCFRIIGPSQFGYSPSLKKALLSADEDLVHTHGIWMYPSVVTLAWHRAWRRPYLVSPHGMLDPWALRNSAGKKRIAWFLFEGDHLRRAACIRALCESEAQSMRACGLKNPICVVPNGVDLPDLQGRHLSTVDSPLREFKADGRKVMLYLGRLHPKKGLVNLILAWASLQRTEVRARRPAEWVLAIAGWDQGGHERVLRRQTAECGVGKSVRFLGPLFGEPKATACHGCDAFILPSFSEGLPMAVLEAWAHGKPVLMTPECNLPEGFQANAAIRLKTNVEEIAHGLQSLFDMSEADRCAMGGRGKKLVAEQFSWPKIASDMKAVYDWILGGGARPDCVLRD